MKYRRAIVEHVGGPDVMQVVEADLPAPASGQALVKILAADVSFSDVNMRRGRYPGGPRPPFTPGYAMVGVVEQLGPDTQWPAIGQRVAALTVYGSYSQYICLPVTALVPAPAEVDAAEAVCLVVAYVAAHQMLHRVAHVARHQRILVHGAAGGVGTAFLELGHLAEVEIYGTASKPKHNLVARLGAIPIDYRTEDFVERIAALTHGAGVEAVFDPMGSAHLQRSVKSVRNGGTVVAYGFYEVANRGDNVIRDVLSQYIHMALWSLPPRAKHVAFYDIRPQKKKHPDWFREDLTALIALLAAGRVKPVVAGRLPLEGVADAHRRVESGEVQGKLVLLPNP